jgi:hypothetical protein
VIGLNPEPYALTAIDLEAIRHCDRLAVVLNVARGLSKVEAIKTGSQERAAAGVSHNGRHALVSIPGEDDVEFSIPVPITVEGYYRELPASAECYALVYNYPSQKTHASSVLGTLKAGDAVRLHFYPDALSTPALRASRFHGDALYVHIYRKGRLHARFQIAHVVSNVENVRMCRGIPDRGA